MEALPPEILFEYNQCQKCNSEIWWSMCLEIKDCPHGLVAARPVNHRAKSILEHFIVGGRGKCIAVSVFLTTIRRVSKILKTYIDAWDWSKTFLKRKSWMYLGNACRINQPESIRWLMDSFKLSAPTVFDIVCINGELNTIEWFAQRYDLTSKDIRINKYSLIQHLCIYGHKNIIEWISYAFQLDWDPKCARIAALSGHQDLSEWIRTTWRVRVSSRQRALTARAPRKHTPRQSLPNLCNNCCYF